MSSIMKLLRRIGGAKAVPTSGEAGQLAVWKAGTTPTDAVSMYFHDGVQWVEVLDTAIKAVAVSETAPATPSVGALWFKASTKEFSAWDGAQWSHVAFRNTQNTFTEPQAVDVSDVVPALRVTQRGTGLAIRVEDSATPDTTPFAVDADGNVLMSGKLGINNGSPIAAIDILHSADGRLLITENATSFPMISAVNRANNAFQPIEVHAKQVEFYTGGAGTTLAAAIDVAGHLGVGTKTPGANFEVIGTSVTDIAHVRNGDTYVALAATDGVNGTINAWKTGTGFGPVRLDLQTTLGITQIGGDLGVGIALPSSFGGNFRTVHINEVNGGGIKMGAAGVAKFGIAYRQTDDTASLETYGPVPLVMKIDNAERFRLWGTSGQIVSPPTYNNVATGSAVHVNSSGVVSRSSSSRKYKKDIEPLDHSITDNAIKNLRPVWYRPKKVGGDTLEGWSYVGLIAEEVEQVEKRLVHYRTMETSHDENGLIVATPLATPIPEDVDYARLSVLLLDYVQRLEKRVAALEARP